MVAGIVLLALGLKKTVGDVEHELGTVVASAMLGGAAIYLLAHVAFRLRNIGSLNRQRLVCAIALVALIPPRPNPGAPGTRDPDRRALWARRAGSGPFRRGPGAGAPEAGEGERDALTRGAAPSLPSKSDGSRVCDRRARRRVAAEALLPLAKLRPSAAARIRQGQAAVDRPRAGERGRGRGGGRALPLRRAPDPPPARRAAADADERRDHARPERPLLVRGPITVVQPDGTVEEVPRAAFCRCGQSGNKPFCDGSHRDAGFQG